MATSASDISSFPTSLALRHPWLNKAIDQVISNKEQSASLRNFLERNDSAQHFIFYGTGNNGKTTLINEIGSFYPITRVESLLREDRADPIWSQESIYSPTGIVVTTNPIIFRELVAGIPIRVRGIFQSPQIRIPCCSVILETNESPNPLLLRRAILIEFPYTFGIVAENRITSPRDTSFYRYLGYATAGVLSSALLFWIVRRGLKS